MMKRLAILTVVFLVPTASAAEIPFPSALDLAAVVETRIADLKREALVLGNGDLNALLWDRDGALCLRVTKNDIWDARIDTSKDPELMTMDIGTRTWQGGASRIPSWHGTPYPTPRCGAVIVIGEASRVASTAGPWHNLYVMSKDGQPAEVIYPQIQFDEEGSAAKQIDLSVLNTSTWSARLDLRRAKATFEHDRQAITVVRALADRNVFLIEGPGDVSLEEVPASYLPSAKLGVTAGVKWLHMVMPGDVDYQGMEYALAVAAAGATKAVSVVTSFDTNKNVLETAVGAAREALAVRPIDLIRTHEAAWTEFWSASGLQLGDRFFQDAWYRNMYYMRCFCRPGTTMPITLYAGLANDKPGWHGAPTLNYNIEQTFWPMYSCNQVDLMEPYVRYIAGFAPRGRWLARKTYGLEGLCLPSNIFGPEYLVPPKEAKSKHFRQIAYVPWSYTLGLTGWGLQNLWLRYKYQPDLNYLESVYPLLRDGAEFYANVIEQCRDDDGDGKVEVGPSYNPEHGPFGTFNTPVDIAYLNFLLDAASEAAHILGRDAQLAERWQQTRRVLPDYETTMLKDESIVANWKGADANSVPVHNVASPTVPIFPAEQITWFSAPAEKTLFERTLRWIKHNGNNAHIMVNVARARMSMPEAYTETRAHFSKIVTPNGLYAGWPGHGYYLSESWAFAGLTAELLLQSVDDIIRLFPAWPSAKDAAFANLRAQGGFLVSAEQKNGKVTHVKITSTVGGTLHLLSPWPAIAVRNGVNAPVALTPDARGVVTLETRPNEELVLIPAPK